jgi:phosphate uptake regulator
MSRAEFKPLLEKALSHLEDALQGVVEDQERRLDLSVFRAVSEVEHVTFLLSQELGDNYASTRLRRQKRGSLDLGPSLALAYDLIMQSIEDIGDLRGCYARLSECRSILAAVQEELFQRSLRKGR